MHKILLVEDDLKIGRVIARTLSDEGFEIEHCKTAQEARLKLSERTFSLMLLDWMLPDTDGIRVAQELRRLGERLPILMLTARGDTKDKVLGLEAGADDYLAKPFEVEELIARVRALLRRSLGQGKVTVGPLEVDRVEHKVRLKGEPMTLTSREYALLAFLLSRMDKVVSRAELLEHVWGASFDPGSNLVEVHVSRLREKLDEHAWMIETVRGAGYRFRQAQA